MTQNLTDPTAALLRLEERRDTLRALPALPEETEDLTTPSLDEIGGELPETPEPTQDPQASPEIPDSPEPEAGLEEEDWGFTDYVADVGRGVASGVEDFLMGAYGLVDTLTADILWDWDEKTIDSADSTVGKVVQGLTHFAAGFAVTGGVLAGATRIFGAASKIGKAATFLNTGGVVSAAAKGAATDFAFFRGQEERLSTSIQGTPLENPITAWLANDEDDSEIEGRIKNTLEGMALGGIFDITMAGLRALKRTRKAVDGLPPEATKEEVDAVVAKTMGSEEVLEATRKTVENSPNARAGIGGEGPDLYSPEIKNALKTLGVDDLEKARSLFKRLEKFDPEDYEQELFKFFRGPDNEFLNLGQLQDYESAVSAVRALDVLVRQSGFGTRTAQKDDILAGYAKRLQEWIGFDTKGYETYMTNRTYGGGALKDVNDIARISNNMATDVVALKMAGEDWAKGVAAGGSAAYAKMGTEELLEHMERTVSLADFIDAVLQPRSATGTALQSLQIKPRVPHATKLRTQAAAKGQVRQTAEERLMEVTRTGTTAAAQRRAVNTLERMHAALEASGGNADEAMRSLVANSRAISSKRRAWAKTSEYWFGSLLSGFKTHMVNALSNTITMAHSPAEKIIGGTVQGAITLDYGVAKDAYIEAMDEIGSYAQSFLDILKLKKGRIGPAIADSLRTGNSGLLRDSGSMLQQEGADQGAAITGRAFRESALGQAVKGVLGERAQSVGAAATQAFGAVARTPGKLLAAEDEFFKQLNFRAAATVEFKKEARKLIAAGADINIADFVNDRMNRLIMDGAAVDEYRLYEVAVERARKKIRDSGRNDSSPDLVQQVAREEYEGIYAENERILEVAALGRKQAEERTFTGPMDGHNVFIKGGQILTNAKRTMPALQFFAPFVKTPANILSYAHERLPVEPLMGALHYGRDLLRNDGTFSEVGNRSYKALMNRASNPEEYRLFLARSAQAAGAVSIVGYLALNALEPGKETSIAIYGQGPSDHKERAAWEAAGNKAYSIRVGNTNVSYERLEPFSTMLGTIADAMQYVHFSQSEATNEKLGYALLGAVTNNFTRKSYLTGMENLLGIIMNTEEAQLDAAIRQFAGSFVPAAASQFKDAAVDDDVREVRSILEQLKKRVPFMGDSLDKRRDVLGRPLKKIGWDDKENGWQAFASRWSPVPLTSDESNPVLDELARLNHGWSAAGRNLTVGSFTVDLTEYRNAQGQSALDRYRELSGTIALGGQTLYDTLESFITSDAYKAMPDVRSKDPLESPKIRKISSIIANYRSAAKAQVLQEFPDILGDREAEVKSVFNL